MTFNQNGDMLQLVNMDVRLGQQYPSATMNLFQSFTGVAYRVQAWQKFIELPIAEDASDFRTGLIANYNFLIDNYTSGSGWQQGSGPLLSAPNAGVDFDFIYDKVPSNADFANPELYG